MFILYTKKTWDLWDFFLCSTTVSVLLWLKELLCLRHCLLSGGNWQWDILNDASIELFVFSSQFDGLYISDVCVCLTLFVVHLLTRWGIELGSHDLTIVVSPDLLAALHCEKKYNFCGKHHKTFSFFLVAKLYMNTAAEPHISQPGLFFLDELFILIVYNILWKRIWPLEWESFHPNRYSRYS